MSYSTRPIETNTALYSGMDCEKCKNRTFSVRGGMDYIELACTKCKTIIDIDLGNAEQ
jgi:hypothetical protein